MLTFEEVIARLKDILSTERGEKRMYDKDVAEVLGIDPAYFAVLKKRNRLPLEAIITFCAERAISINWLLFNQVPRALEERVDGFTTVRYFKTLRALSRAEHQDSERSERLYLNESIVRMLGGTHHLKWIDAVGIVGDAMEPLIRDGAIIFIDRSMTDIDGGGIFVVQTSAGTFVKRLIRRGQGEVELLAVNPLYPSEMMPSDKIEILGKVVGKMEGRKF
jgi:SOS-response transcriptional repressor LexA